MRIKDKIAALNGQEAKAKHQGIIKEAGLGLIGGGLFIGGILSIIAAPVAAVALCSIGAGMISGYRKRRNERVAKVEAIRQEKASLRRLTQNGINVSDQHQKQRKANASQAGSEAATAKNELTKAKEGTGIRRFNVGTAGLLAMIIPGPIGIVAAAATVGLTAYKIYKDNKIVNSNSKFEQANAKKDYLDTEIKIADNIIEARKKRRKAAQQAAQAGNTRGNTNTNTNQRQATPQPVNTSSPSKEQSENEMIVDEYIKRLSEHPEETETTALTIR